MRDPDITFHAEYCVEQEVTVPIGQILGNACQSVDVAGADYSASVEGRWEGPDGSRHPFSFEVVRVDGSTFVRSQGESIWLDASGGNPSGPAGIPPNPFSTMDAGRLTYLGVAGGLHEFDIQGWILGATFDPWDATAPFDLTGIARSSSETRVLLDDTSLPRFLHVSFAYTDLGLMAPGEAVVRGEYSQFGESVEIHAPHDDLNDAAAAPKAGPAWHPDARDQGIMTPLG